MENLWAAVVIAPILIPAVVIIAGLIIMRYRRKQAEKGEKWIDE